MTTFTLTEYVRQRKHEKEVRDAFDSLPFATRAAIVNKARRQARRDYNGRGPETAQVHYEDKVINAEKRYQAVPAAPINRPKNKKENVVERFVVKTSAGKGRPSRRTKVKSRQVVRVIQRPKLEKPNA